MPAVPEFIALPKKKEMFALSSWRDSVGLHGQSRGEQQPSPIMSAVDALRGNKLPVGGAAALSPPQPAHAAEAAAVSDATDPRRSVAEAQGPAAANGARASRWQRGGRNRSRQPQQPQQPLDVDDFFVHVALPRGVAYEAASFELQAQSTPLKVVDVGRPLVLFPRRSSAGGGKEAARGAPAVRLSPFATPAVHAAHAATEPEAMPSLDEDRDGATGGFLLPPAELTAQDHSAAAAAAATTTAAAASSAAAAADGADDQFHFSMCFAEKEEADKTAAFIHRRWPAAVVAVVPRNRSVLNASLVLKGLPTMSKTEHILEELGRLPCKPSYVRIHRGERGVYKNVVFVKYANGDAAEDSKLRLERFLVGVRALKVEFKRKCRSQGTDSAAAAATASIAAAAAAAAANDNDEEDNAASAVALQQTVRDLRVSTEHEGFVYKREDLTKGEVKLLKQLCQSYGLSFDMTEAKVTVKRPLGGAAGSSTTHSAGPSPSLRPHQLPPPPTPAWAPTTPTPLRPMDFKGISHWKDIRGQQSTLGIVRPIGPEDGGPAFSAGRGRPL